MVPAATTTARARTVNASRALPFGPLSTRPCTPTARPFSIKSLSARQSLKILVPRAILNQHENLSPADWEILRRHPADGAQMLAGVDHLRSAVPYVLYHHERWDGKGYPHGLAGTDIPVEGRLLAVVDSYDAMTSERPYRAGRDRDSVCAEIDRLAGTQFDPEMAHAFAQLRWLSD
jgi:HD-GYP domain-containing protein (c-di-GMP phosphodiesterase class II)